MQAHKRQQQEVLLLNTPWLNRKIIHSSKNLMSAQSCKQKRVDQVNWENPKPHKRYVCCMHSDQMCKNTSFSPGNIFRVFI